MRWAKKALLAKIEGTYGVDAAPGNTDAVLIFASDVNLTPIVANAVEREVVRAGGQFGQHPSYLVGKHVMLEFSVELAGSGAVDTPPPYAPLLLACAGVETVNVATSVVYNITSDEANHDSVSMYFHIDGVRHAMLGCRGDVTWNFVWGQRPSLRFRFLGLFVAVADAAFPAPDVSDYQKPMVVSDANTPTLTLHGTSVVTQSLTVTLGNVVEYRELVNAQEIVIPDRRTVGQIVFEHAAVATKDWFGAVTGETLAALQIIHGVGAGKICQLDAPKVQLTNPQLSGSQNRTMLTIDLLLTPNTGDDELVFTTK